MMNRTWYSAAYLLIFFQLVLLGNNAWAYSDEEIREAIQTVLKNRHPNETGEWWRSLGPSASKIMINIYLNENNIYHKVRLMDSLVWFSDSSTVSFMKQESESQSNQVIKRAAINSLIRSQGMKEKEYISGVLKDRNPHTREAAAKALLELEDSKAIDFVEQYLKNEKIVWITSKLRIHQRELVSRRHRRLPAQIQRD